MRNSTNEYEVSASLALSRPPTPRYRGGTSSPTVRVSGVRRPRQRQERSLRSAFCSIEKTRSRPSNLDEKN
eukprot:1191509-Prorocentrum_minimum.AAC.1